MSLKAAVIGQVVIDVVEPERPVRGIETGSRPRRLGGKGFNIGVALARLGVDVDILSAVGGDDAGERGRRQLAAEGVSVSHLRSGTYGRGSVVITPEVSLTEGLYGAREWQVRLDPRIDDFYRQALADLVNSSYDIVFVTLEFSDKVLVPLATELRRARGTGPSPLIVLNPAPCRQRGAPSPAVTEMLRVSDILTPNRYEAAFLTGETVCERPDTRPADRLFDIYGVRECYVTFGELGWAWTNIGSDVEYGKQALPPAEVVDKVGASDEFTAALGVARFLGAPPRLASLFAGTAAREAVGRPGGAEAFPTQEELTIQSTGDPELDLFLKKLASRV